MKSLVVLNKPKRGEPCNRCGLCCERELCDAAILILKPGHEPYPSPDWNGPCPFLAQVGEGPETACGLLLLKPELGFNLMIGIGCLAPDEHRRIDSTEWKGQP